MSTPSNQARIKKAVEAKIVDLLKKGAAKPEKEELQVLTLGVKYLAVAAKLEEAEFGKDLGELIEDDPDDKTVDAE